MAKYVLILIIVSSCSFYNKNDANKQFNVAHDLYNQYQFSESLTEFEKYIEICSDTSNLEDSLYTKAYHFMAVSASKCVMFSYADSLFKKGRGFFKQYKDTNQYCRLLIDYGIHQQKVNEFDQAQIIFNDAILLAKQCQNKDLHTFANILLAKNFRFKNDYTNVELMLDSVIHEDDVINNQKLYLYYTCERAWLYQCLLYFKKYEELSSQAFQIGRNSDDMELRGLSYYMIANSGIDNFILHDLLSYIDSAQFYYGLLNDKYKVALIDILRSDYLSLTSDNKQALMVLDSVEKYFIETSNKVQLSVVNLFKAEIYNTWNNSEKLLEKYKIAESYGFEKVKDSYKMRARRHVYFDLFDKFNSQEAYDFLLSTRKSTKNENHFYTEVDCLRMFSLHYLKLRDFSKATCYIDTAENLFIKNNSEYNLSKIYNLRAKVCVYQRDMQGALLQFKKAISNDSLYASKSELALKYQNIAMIYRYLGNSALSEKYVKIVISILEELDAKDILSLILELQAKNVWTAAQDNVEDSVLYRKYMLQVIKFSEQAIKLKEELRETSDSESRRKYFNSECGIYIMYIDCLKKLGYKDAEFEAVEVSKTKWLEEMICENTEVSPNIKLADFQQKIDSNSVFLNYAKRMMISYHFSTINKSNYSTKVINNLVFVNSELKFLPDFISYIEKADSSLNFPLRADSKDIEKERVYAGSVLNHFINYYRQLIQNRSFSNEEFDNFKLASKALYRFLVYPLEENIKGKENLIIIPDGLLGFIPFETLMNDKDQYLIEVFDIQYAPSISVWQLLNDRKYPKRSKEFVAFGNANYEKDTLAENSNPEIKTYTDLGYTDFDDISCSLEEINNIAKEFSNCQIYLGDEVSESILKELSEDDELLDFEIIHFSTHGIFVPSRPDLSALVLPAGSESEDGFVNASEIAKLKIRADFVNLSACETGLGEIYEGEGVIGIAQSFVIAGANSMSVSLWQVADKSTSLFMTEMYKMTRNEGLSYSAAMNKVKRNFIKGTYHESLKYPYYWAPFVYYGK